MAIRMGEEVFVKGKYGTEENYSYKKRFVIYPTYRKLSSCPYTPVVLLFISPTTSHHLTVNHRTEKYKYCIVYTIKLPQNV